MVGCIVRALLAAYWEPRLPLHTKPAVRRGARQLVTEAMRSSSTRSDRAKRKQDLRKTYKRSAVCSDPIPTQSKVKKAGVLKLALEVEEKPLTPGSEWHVKTEFKRSGGNAPGSLPQETASLPSCASFTPDVALRLSSIE